MSNPQPPALSEQDAAIVDMSSLASVSSYGSVRGDPGVDQSSLPPEGGTPAPASGVVPPPVAPATAPSGPITVHGRLFASWPEAQAYLDTQLRMAETVIRAAPMPQAGSVPPPIDPADLLHEDPRTALRMVEDRAYERFQATQRAQDDAKARVGQFYAAYDDLRGQEQFVDFVSDRMARDNPQLKNLPVADAHRLIATAARQELQKIRGVPASGQPLPSGAAVVASSGGAPTQPREPAPPAKPSTFIDELQAARRRKAK